MTTGKMHADEVDTDVSLVGRLLAAQFPQWTNLPIKLVPYLPLATPLRGFATRLTLTRNEMQ